MNSIRVIFTKDYYSPLSWLIRWALPRSRFSIALSSHCYIDIDGRLYQAATKFGVNVVNMDILKETETIVSIREYPVLDKSAAIDFLIAQIGKKYDYLGALGLAIAPDRKWNEDDSWFCYELVAGCLRAGLGEQFNNINHITETALLSIQSTIVIE